MRGCDERVHFPLLLYSFSFNVPKASNYRLCKFAGEANNKHHKEAGKTVSESDQVAQKLNKPYDYDIPVGSFLYVTID